MNGILTILEAPKYLMKRLQTSSQQVYHGRPFISETCRAARGQMHDAYSGALSHAHFVDGVRALQLCGLRASPFDTWRGRECMFSCRGCRGV